jgi:hypothetical protein
MSGTVPVLCFIVKPKIFGLACTVQPKLESFLQTSSGVLIDEVKSELVGYLYGYDVPKARGQASQIAMTDSLFSVSNLEGVTTALLDPDPLSFLKRGWSVLFRTEVPNVF